MVALNIDGWKQNGWFEKMMDENMCLFCVSKLSRFFFWKYAPLYFKLLRRLRLIYGVINSYVLGCWPLNRQYNSIKLILLCSKHSIHNQLADLHLFFFGVSRWIISLLLLFWSRLRRDNFTKSYGTRERTYTRR